MGGVMRLFGKLALVAGAILAAKWVYDTFLAPARPGRGRAAVPDAASAPPNEPAPEPPPAPATPPITFRNVARVP
jgi:hypothetical protein